MTGSIRIDSDIPFQMRDGVTLRAENSEDGFPIPVGLSIILRLRELLPKTVKSP